MGCIADIVYGDVECNCNCDNCHWWDRSQEKGIKTMTLETIRQEIDNLAESVEDALTIIDTHIQRKEQIATDIEAIRQEITDKAQYYYKIGAEEVYQGMCFALSIIDKHIQKGKSEGVKNDVL